MKSISVFCSVLFFALLTSCVSVKNAPDNTAYYFYNSRSGINQNVSKVDTYGAGGTINLAYKDKENKGKCIQIISPENSFGGTPYSFLSFSLKNEAEISTFNSICFNIKTSDYSTVSFIINNQKGNGSISYNNYASDISNGWLKIVIPFTEVPGNKMPTSIGQISFAFEGKGKLLISDIGFIR